MKKHDPITDRRIVQMFDDGVSIEMIERRCKCDGYIVDGDLRKSRPYRHIMQVIYDHQMEGRRHGA